MRLQRIRIAFPIIALVIVALFRVLIFTAAYFSYQKFNSTSEQKLPLSQLFNFAYIFPPVMLFAEAICYLIFRKRFFIRKYVLLHVWITIVSSFILPLLQIIFLIFILPNYFSLEELSRIGKLQDYYAFYISWLLFAIARLFFIIAMLKSVTSLKEPEQADESTGFLNDFTQ